MTVYLNHVVNDHVVSPFTHKIADTKAFTRHSAGNKSEVPNTRRRLAGPQNPIRYEVFIW